MGHSGNVSLASHPGSHGKHEQAHLMSELD